MNSFSVYNYELLSDKKKFALNKALAHGLSSDIEAIKNDDVIGTTSIVDFITTANGLDPLSAVTNLFSLISGGIQAGSGNQNLFHCILAVYNECWAEINC